MKHKYSQSFLLSERNSMSFESVSHDIDRDGNSSNTWRLEHQQLVKLSRAYHTYNISNIHLRAKVRTQEKLSKCLQFRIWWQQNIYHKKHDQMQ